MIHSEGTITKLLYDVRSGRVAALDELFQLLYDDLREMARHELRHAGNDPIHATTLVHTACQRLLAKNALCAEDRRHFYFILGRAMHDVLVEQIRSEQTLKRGAGWKKRPLVEFEAENGPVRADIIDLGEALADLQATDPSAHKMVLLRFFGGRTMSEAAELMGCTMAVGRGHWDYARAWLQDRLTPDSHKNP